MPTTHTYRCEAVAHDLTGNREVILDTYRAATPRLAARWARQAARRYACLLAPAPTAPYLRSAPLVEAEPDGPRPDAALHAWADSAEQYEHALHTLAAGRAYAITATDYDARYALCVYPLPVRRPSPTPPPARSARARPYAGVGRHRKPGRLLLDLCEVS
ncbi:hypothetical protein [Streptomyces indicus]|uniref:Uncharacterized protein n=1 Tax=Streptomyces indicus TaxID=417292 RepID=A0A1G9K2J6_9ACTN|nr:hypothetical protein [Streptomyces indicus]SDL43624.1 hypothetical protein SAMN05421806_1414 [Streptomyces indicus]